MPVTGNERPFVPRNQLLGFPNQLRIRTWARPDALTSVTGRVRGLADLYECFVGVLSAPNMDIGPD